MSECSIFCVFAFVYLVVRFQPAAWVEDEDRTGEPRKAEQPVKYSQIMLLLVTSVIQTFGETVITVLWPLHIRKLGLGSHDYAWLQLLSQLLIILSTLPRLPPADTASGPSSNCQLFANDCQRHLCTGFSATRCFPLRSAGAHLECPDFSGRLRNYEGVLPAPDDTRCTSFPAGACLLLAECLGVCWEHCWKPCCNTLLRARDVLHLKRCHSLSGYLLPVLHRWLRHRRCIVRADRGWHQQEGECACR